MSAVFYLNKKKDPISIPLFRDKFYIDTIYAGIVRAFQDSIGACLDFVDRKVIEPLVARFPAVGAMTAGSLLRLFQVGNLHPPDCLSGH